MYFYDFELKLLLQHFGEQTLAKRLVYGKICIKACLEIKKKQVHSMLQSPPKYLFSIEIEISATVIFKKGALL